MKVFGKRCQTDMPPPAVLSAARREQSGARKELCSWQHLVRRAKTSVTFGYLVWTTTHDASLNRSCALPQPRGLCSLHCSARAGGCQPSYPDRQLPVSTGLWLPTPLAKPTRCLLLASPPALALGDAAEPSGDAQQSLDNAVGAGPLNSHPPSLAARRIILQVAQAHAQVAKLATSLQTHQTSTLS